MVKITEEEYKKIDAFEDAWGKNLIDYLGARDETEAARAVSVYMGGLERSAVLVNGLFRKFAENASPTRKARLSMGASEITMPALTKTFGEQALFDAMPVFARTEEFADLARRAGGNKLANFITTSLEQKALTI